MKFSNLSELKLSLIKGSIGSIGLKVGNLGLGFLSTLIIARLLGSSAFGVYSFVLSFVSLLSIPAQLGLPQFMVRQTAYYRALKNWGMMRGLFFWAGKNVVIFSFSLTIISGFILYIVKNNLDAELFTTFVTALFLIPILAFTAFAQASLRGLHHVLLGQLPEMIIKRGVFIGLALSLYLLKIQKWMVPTGAMVLHVGAAFIAALFAIYLFLKYAPGELKNCKPEIQGKQWLFGILPFLFLGSMQVLNNHTDVTMLGILKSPEEVGPYKVAVQLSMLISIPLQAINMVIAPQIARLWTEKKLKKLQSMITWSARAILVLSFPLAFLFIYFGEQIVAILFGADFLEANKALIILSLGQIINTGMGSVGLLLNMTGHEMKAAKSLGIAVLVNLVLNLTLIPQFGSIGAALATASSYLIWNIYMGISVWKSIHINPTAFGLLKTKI